MKNRTLSKILSVFLAVTIIFGSAPLSGFSGIEFPDLFSVKAEAYTEGNFNYSVSNGKATLTGCVDPTGDIVIPEKLGGYPVTSIGSSAFSNCRSLTSVTIPDSVTSIGYEAFYDCTSLARVYYTGDIEDWCNISFNDWDANPMGYAKNFYMNNTLVKEIVIPDTVTEIKDYAFCSFEGITSVTIPDSVTSIGEGAFSSCTSLISVTIPDSVTSIGSSVFSGCTSLTSVTIPDSVTSIGYYAFYNCTSLASVTIGDSMTNIGDYAFYNCTSLARVYYTGDIEDWCNISFVNYSANPMYYAKNFYIDNSLVKEIVIPDNVTEIKAYAFYSFEGVTSVTIGNSVTSIGSCAFYDCTSLTSVTIPDSVTSIGVGAFLNCESLTSVTIPDSVTSIGNSAFDSCSSLASITIPDSVESIGYGAFFGCYNLTDAYYTGDIKSWIGIEFGNSNSNPKFYADNIYFNGEVVENIIIPEDTTAIKGNIFCNFDSVKTVTIPASVITIHENVFYKCNNIEKVIFEGTESQWEEMIIYDGNDYLKNAEVTFLNGGHEHYYSSSVTTEPTCTEEGVKTFTCGCGDTYTEVIPATGHTWSKWMVAVEPTETDNGFKARFCTICDDAIESEVLPATGSGDGEKTGITITLTDENGNVVFEEIISDKDTDISFENGTYTLTISKENYVTRTVTVTASDNMLSADLTLNKVGDMNGDGKVNAVDVARANAHAKGVSSLSGYALDCVDVNGDGKVNAVDVALLNAHSKGVKSLW